jgi:hypothetical protein
MDSARHTSARDPSLTKGWDNPAVTSAQSCSDINETDRVAPVDPSLTF